VTLTEGILPSGGRIKENRDGSSLRSTGECFVGPLEYQFSSPVAIAGLQASQNISSQINMLQLDASPQM
jgi:hypothetical protein